MAGKKKKVEEVEINTSTIEEVHAATSNYTNAIGTLGIVAATSESQLKAGVDKHARRIAGGDYGLDNLLLEELYTGLALASSDPAEARGHIVNAAAIAAVIVDSIDAQLTSAVQDWNEDVEEALAEQINDSTVESDENEDDTEAPVEPTEDEIAAAADAFSDLAE